MNESVNILNLFDACHGCLDSNGKACWKPLEPQGDSLSNTGVAVRAHAHLST